MPLSTQLLFSALYALASSINHIDDTDETYGYFEPMHYLLYGFGMQTWEYSPEYSIRSYAFLAPFSAAGACMRAAGMSKRQVFYGTRLILSQIMACAMTKLVQEASKVFGERRCSFLVMTIAACPGIFFCSSAFLPSAVGCALVALGVSTFLSEHHGYTILFGCLAVLWTGWPFIGLIFLPLGLAILYRQAVHLGFQGVFRITAIGVFHLAVVSAGVLLIDSHYYGKRTFPPLNILLYNALSGNGDELYGIEPVSYYLKNLILTLGVSFPMALVECCFCVIDILRAAVDRRVCDPSTMTAELTICSCAALWLSLLFSRPHKEERFLYPIYPILCLLSAMALSRIQDMFTWLLSPAPSPDMGKKRALLANSGLGNSFRIVVFLFMGAVGFSRVFALHNNFSGYLHLWYQLRETVVNNPSVRSGDTVNRPATVCMGSDWYTFPSHFFMPENARLAYFSDGFGGILPQHFAEKDGTSGVPLHPFNDRNREEAMMYIGIDSCDFLVRTMQESDRHVEKNKIFFDESKFEQKASANIIDPSSSLLVRVINLPGGIIEELSNKKILYHNYTLFKRITLEDASSGNISRELGIYDIKG